MNSYNLINANIITLDAKCTQASSITVSNGKIESINSICKTMLNKISAIELLLKK